MNTRRKTMGIVAALLAFLLLTAEMCDGPNTAPHPDTGAGGGDV